MPAAAGRVAAAKAAAVVVIRAPNWLGDTVMAVPALAALRAAMPEARITVVGRWAPLLHAQDVADVLVEYPRDRASRTGIARALAADPADLALLLVNSFEAALAAWRWGARRRIGFDTDARRPLLTDAVPLPAQRRHQVDEYRLLVQSLGIEAPADTPRLRRVTDQRTEAEVAALLESVAMGRDARPVGLHLGASGGPAKQWPAEAWAGLADRLARAGRSALLLGGPEDGERACQTLGKARSAPASLVGKDRPALLPHLLSRLACLVSGDTGVAHLAAALGVPTVTLFGPTDPRLTAPRGAAGRTLIGPAPCAPCFLAACPIEHVCLRAIAPEAVEAMVREPARA